MTVYNMFSILISISLTMLKELCGLKEKSIPNLLTTRPSKLYMTFFLQPKRK